MIAEIRVRAGQKFPRWRFRKFEQEKKRTWTAVLSEKKAASMVKKARKMGFTACVYEEKYGRSGTYRQTFIRMNPPRNGYYRCAYCGRLVREKDMEVDHVIPVQKAKYTEEAQQLLSGKDVNSRSNLVASCHRCNIKKGTSLSPKWRRRARLGRHDAYWALRGIFCALLLLALVLTAVAVSKGYFNDLAGSARETVRQAEDMFPYAAGQEDEIIPFE